MSGDTLARLTAALAGRFQIERELDGGGMSRVFLAVETALGRNVVLKVLPAELAAVISVERFRREILLLARLQHAHIVPVLSAGDADGLLYFSMPYVEGESLRVRLARQGELPLTDAIRMLREIASALSYAHAQGVVHRDIKPANVLLSGDAAMVTDFGVAKALRVSTDVVDEQTTSGGVAMGTAAYMAPEQASADPALDHRADLYAFGVLAYELLTGQPPFVGRTPQALLSAHVAEAPEPVTRRRPALPPAIAELVMRCLEKRPADRPQSATDIIRVLDELSPSGRSAPAAAAAHADPDSGTRRVRLPAVRGARITGVLLVVGAVISVAWWGLSRESTVAGGVWRGSGTAVDATTIAVLPFKSGGAGDEYLADGLTDELPSALKKIPGLRVMGGRSVYAFKSKPASVAQIGRALKVGALLEGTVRRSGSRLKITTQLTKVSDGLLIWSESYESDAQDVFRVQSEIASAIAGALQLALAPDSARHVVAAKAPDPRAHDLYLQGRFSLYKFTNDGVQQALAQFERAVAIEPNYAEALAGISGVWTYIAPDWAAPDVAYPKARAAARRALAADSLLAESRIAWSAALLFNDWDVEGAEREARRAIALDSGSALGYDLLGIILRARGRYDESRAATRRAQELDPLMPQFVVNEAEAFQDEGRHDAALQLLRRAIELDSTYAFAHVRMAYSLMYSGRSAEAFVEARRGAAMRDRSRFAVAEINARSGRQPDARTMLAELQADARQRYVSADGIARIQLALGDHAGALASLERALVERASGVLWLASREYDPVRADPRFVAIVREVGGRR